MSASNAFINWHTFSFTPTGGSAITLTRINSVKPNRDGTPEKYKGDAAVFYQLIAVPTQERSVDVETADVATAATIPIGTPGTLSVVLDDMVNKATASGGGFTLALTNCVCTKNPFSGDHAKVASGTLTFEGFATNGATDPLTITPL